VCHGPSDAVVPRRVSSLRIAPLHPVAWWVWAILLAAAAARITNPICLGLILAVCGWVVVSRRPQSTWARSYSTLLRLGAVVVVIRVVFQALFGVRTPGHTLFTIPSLSLPSWMAGVTVGGPVTADALVGAACQGLRLAAILGCVGAANALVSPFRLLRCVPAGLYEVAVAVTVAVSFTPQVITSLGQVRDARRLRGRAISGVAGVRGLAVPVLEGALERSMALAASMDSRGFGRRAVSATRQRLSSAATLVGLLGLAVGAYGVLDSGAPSALGLPVIGVGAVLVTAGLAVSSFGNRSRYRPDRWSGREWCTVAVAAVALAAVVVVGRHDAASLSMPVYPLSLPAVPPVALVGLLLAALPSIVAAAPLDRWRP
jgi:energy-coupling factor transport system permease protein